MRKEKDINSIINDIGKTSERDLNKSLTHNRPDPKTNPPSGRLTSTTQSNGNTGNSESSKSDDK